jgi:hypothetical protein
VARLGCATVRVVMEPRSQVTAEQPGAQPRVALALLAVTQFLMTLDATVMNVSFGALAEDLDTSVTAIHA